MNIGDKIIWVSNWIDGNISEGMITKVTQDFVYVDHHHLPEDCIYRIYALPYEAREQAEAVLKERARLKKALDDSMALVYQLTNNHHEWRNK